ncbi:MAG TPA: SDR family NAD(P)-dependent oxidoreductase [Usitatibacteraceae bacterium]|nr:SDR family NAD(P)-dependent oxidoreductase [Usitatibacteraceae bacterium]
MKEFAGKVAVITGAAEGIGRAVAEEAAARGMKLLLADIDAARLDATTAELRAKGADADGLRTDVSKASQVDDLADLAFGRFGRVHLLVANAGVACAKPVWDTSPEDWEWVMGVNFYGVTHVLRAFLPRMMAGGEEGHVVATASMAGLLSLPGMAAYNASKHAVVTVMEGLHHDLTLRSAKIGACVLCPSWVKTRIALSERNRTSGEVTRPEDLDPVTARLAAAVQRAVDGGIEPGEAARAVFAAVSDGRFYVLTHGDSKSGVKARLDAILHDRVPPLVRL